MPGELYRVIGEFLVFKMEYNSACMLMEMILSKRQN